MSIEKKPEEKRPEQKPQPNPLGFLDVRRTDEKASIIRDIITSDKNNPTKANIPNVFGMAVLRMLTAWSSTTGRIDYVANGENKSVPKTVNGMGEFFYDTYNIVSRAHEGKALEQYERAASSWLAQAQALQQTAQNIRMEEGVKSKPK